MGAELLASTWTLLAQTTSAPARSAVQIESVWDFAMKGGWMMIPIGICSLVALTVIVERAISLARRRVIPPSFLPGLEAVLRGGRGDARQALDYCKQNASPVANVFAAGIRRLHEPVELLEKHIADAGEREVFKLRKHIRVLQVTAAIAPLLGLLGTIVGMIIAFQTIAASAEALGKTEQLAKGIYQAMITTAAGLSVAIPALIGFHWISAKVERLVSEIDQMTVDFVEEYAHRDTPAGAPATKPAAAIARVETPPLPSGVPSGEEEIRLAEATDEATSGDGDGQLSSSPAIAR